MRLCAVYRPFALLWLHSVRNNQNSQHHMVHKELCTFMMWSKPDDSTLFSFFSEATAASVAASIGPPQHCSLKGWMRIRVGGREGWGEGWGGGEGALSKQPSRVGEVSQREEKSKELEIKVGKNIYKVNVEDFLKRWRNSQMSFFPDSRKDGGEFKLMEQLWLIPKTSSRHYIYWR